MDARKLVLPAAALLGGALLGRMIGIKGLVRAGMAALTVANVSRSAGLLTAGQRAPRKKAVQRTTRKRVAHRKSAPRKTASVPAGTQTH
jgi:hypothetical protein